MKYIFSIVSISAFCSSYVYASPLQCDSVQLKSTHICHTRFDELRQRFNSLSLTTLLITDAPHKLIKDSHQLWLKQIQQCKSHSCRQHQFEQRMDQLNFFTSLNQTLTQHYLKFENGKIAQHPVHLQIHQLSKDNLKIEAIAYRNPNNRLEKRSMPFLAYSTVAEKFEIHDNENDCKYQFKYQKALLKVSSEQEGCERFSGIYRLYD